MRLNNKACALVACLALAGCLGGSGDRPRIADPVYGDAPPTANPQGYPRPGSDAEPPATDYNDPYTMLPVGPRIPAPQPLRPGEMDAAPPLSDGPSATSDRDAGRYDEVGYATWYGPELAGNRTASGAPFNPQGFTAAHRTLPLGSFVEVTSLDTGRTILVLVNDRGPQQASLLIDLSQGAAQALGIKGRGAVRVRRVFPSPTDIAAIRAGQPGTPRLDTPAAVLAGLRQRLGGATAVPIPQRRPLPRVAPVPQTTTPSRPVPNPGPAPTKPAATGGFYVQVAAFSAQARAAALAKSLGGQAVSAGSVWRVRLGPYANADQAQRARDAAAARGYGDARVVRED